MTTTEPTVEQCLEELREMFPDALRIYVSNDTDYFDGVVVNEAFILITHETFRAPRLREAMAQVRAYYAQQSTTDRKVKRQ